LTDTLSAVLLRHRIPTSWPGRCRVRLEERRCADRRVYAWQLLQYLEAVGAPRGAVVYLTLAEFDWMER